MKPAQIWQRTLLSLAHFRSYRLKASYPKILQSPFSVNQYIFYIDLQPSTKILFICTKNKIMKCLCKWEIYQGDNSSPESQDISIDILQTSKHHMLLVYCVYLCCCLNISVCSFCTPVSGRDSVTQFIGRGFSLQHRTHGVESLPEGLLLPCSVGDFFLWSYPWPWLLMCDWSITLWFGAKHGFAHKACPQKTAVILH